MGEKGEQLGIMPLFQALETARKQDLDLVEVAATAIPPVCRLLDYGKFKYEQAKKERGIRRSQRTSVLREVRLRPKIGEHDLEAKTRLVRKLLGGGDKVLISVLFRGREIIHKEIGLKLLQRVAESMRDMAVLEKQPTMQGRRMSMILALGATQKAKVKERVKEA